MITVAVAIECIHYELSTISIHPNNHCLQSYPMRPYFDDHRNVVIMRKRGGNERWRM